ncbi:hypothetical protein FRC14_005141 [Serendipita sp. 396]|nr:hypothetical protein FRC14_005141 [Serendipita sp. 396]
MSWRKRGILDTERVSSKRALVLGYNLVQLPDTNGFKVALSPCWLAQTLVVLSFIFSPLSYFFLGLSLSFSNFQYCSLICTVSHTAAPWSNRLTTNNTFAPYHN